MSSSGKRFAHYQLSMRADGRPVELERSPGERVFLAFDERIHRLVEIHVLKSGRPLSEMERRSALERACQASEIRGPSFLRILEVGEDEGLVYFSSNLSDGEFIEPYVKRRGPLPPPVAFSLLLQLLDDLIQLQSYHRLISRIRLERVLVTALEDTFLHLRVLDFGFAEKERSAEDGFRRLVHEICRLAFLLLTGKSHEGENCDSFPILTSLPVGLRTLLRHVLSHPDQAPISLERVRDDMREAFAVLAGGLQSRNTKKHLVVSDGAVPKSHLQDVLLEEVPVDQFLAGRFVPEVSEGPGRYPFSCPATSVKNGEPLTVHLLPPSRVVDRGAYELVPLQMWRIRPEDHPNILRSLSAWEGPEWTFLTEERESGFALSRLMAERVNLNASEVLVLLTQVKAGLEQAMECGVGRVDLHPSNVLLRVGKGGVMQAREFERLMQKRLDAWPPFVAKLRPHLTMRSLYEPPLVEVLGNEEGRPESVVDKDFRNRSIVALAVYLLTGERQAGVKPNFPESLPEPLVRYLMELLEAGRTLGATVSPAEFIEKFEHCLSQGADDTASLADRLRGDAVPVEEMESAGSVSDFEEDWAAEEATGPESTAGTSGVSRGSATSPLVGRSLLAPGSFAGAPLEPDRRKLDRGTAGMLAWSALGAGMIAIIMSIYGLRGGESGESAGGGSLPSAASRPGFDVEPGSAAAAPGDAVSQPSVKSRAKQPPTMIRKAIVPTVDELERLKEEQERGARVSGLADRSSPR